jgi:hypothetical protein
MNSWLPKISSWGVCKKVVIKLAVLVVLLSLFYCGKCPESKSNYGPEFGKATKAYFLFAKSGSYWVYKDSISGDIDTLTLIDYYFTTTKVFVEDCGGGRVLSVTFKSKQNKILFSEYTPNNIISIDNGNPNNGTILSEINDSLYTKSHINDKRYFIYTIQQDTVYYNNVYKIKSINKGFEILIAENIGIINYKKLNSVNNTYFSNYKLKNYVIK